MELEAGVASFHFRDGVASWEQRRYVLVKQAPWTVGARKAGNVSSTDGSSVDIPMKTHKGCGIEE